MRRLHPLTMVVAFLPRLAAAFKSLVPFLALSLFNRRDNDYVEIVIAAIGILGGFGAISEYLTTRFGIENGQLVWRTGWIFKRDRQIPLGQVQNVNLKQNILERFLGVTTLEIETAGGKASELKLSVLSTETAEEFRAELLSEIAPEEVSTEEARVQPERVVCELSQRDLMIGGLTENHLGLIFVAFFSVLGLGGYAFTGERVGPAIRQLSGIWSPALAAPVVVLALMAAWIWGTINYVLKYGEFRVTEAGGALRISHGVLTKVQHIVRLDRVEYAQISASILQRKMGRANLHLGTAGNFGEAGKLAPVALVIPRSAALALLKEVTGLDNPDGLVWNPYPKWYRWRVIFGSLLAGMVIAGMVYGIGRAIGEIGSGRSTAMYVAVGLGLLIVAMILITSITGLYQAGYAQDDRAIATRSGFLTQSIQLMPWERIELARVNSPLFWRRTASVSLSVQGMVRQINVTVLTIPAAEQVLARLRRLSALRQANNRPKSTELDAQLTA